MLRHVITQDCINHNCTSWYHNRWSCHRDRSNGIGKILGENRIGCLYIRMCNKFNIGVCRFIWSSSKKHENNKILLCLEMHRGAYNSHIWVDNNLCECRCCRLKTIEVITYDCLLHYRRSKSFNESLLCLSDIQLLQ